MGQVLDWVPDEVTVPRCFGANRRVYKCHPRPVTSLYFLGCVLSATICFRNGRYRGKTSKLLGFLTLYLIVILLLSLLLLLLLLLLLFSFTSAMAKYIMNIYVVVGLKFLKPVNFYFHISDYDNKEKSKENQNQTG